MGETAGQDIKNNDSAPGGKGSKNTQNEPNTFLYDKTAIKEMFTGLKLAVASVRGQHDQPSQEFSTVSPKSTDTDFVATVSDKMFCSYCSNHFANREEQMDHYKGDWHRFNLKQRLKGSNTVTESQFEELLGGAGNLSSISGSDTSSDTQLSDDQEEVPLPGVNLPRDQDASTPEESLHVEGEGRRHPKVFFHNSKGQLLALYRCVLYGKKNIPESQDELVAIANNLTDRLTWAVLMTAGGHFAGAVFEGDKVLVHKTFHRYVVRAKRGTVQSTRDSQGNAPRSAGASLRRHNEAALTQEIQDTLDLWSEHLARCDRIFVRGPGSNRTLYFGGKKRAIAKQDPRLRPIPFSTRRPTFREVQRVHSVLATLECFGTESLLSDHIKTSPKKAVPTPPRAAQATQVAATESDGIGATREDDFSRISTDEEGDVELMADMLTVDTLEVLQPFSATKKSRHKRSKEQNKGGKAGSKTKNKGGEEDMDDDFDVEKFKLRNSLYTACKTGDNETLEDLLKNINLNDPRSGVDALTQSTGESGNPSSPVTVVEKEADFDSSTTTASGPPDQHSPADGATESYNLLNETFGDSQRTLLHIAVVNGQKDIIRTLLKAGADPTIKDRQGKVSYALATDKATRNEFRHFMASFPDKYDYVKAQVPGPLTEEMTAKKKAKDAEKKKAQRKARKEKQKEQKADEAQRKAEEEEKQRFLNLSDREKRALAAERRLMAQCEAQGQSAPAVKRCWQCGVDITGKIPFEYYDYQFCTTKCLKEHKMRNTQR